MYFPLFIALRYFSTISHKNFIHRMSLVACLSVGLSTLALILVLSIFNGLEGVIKNLFHSFDPDLKIQPKEGKHFTITPEIKQQFTSMNGITKVVEVIEDKVLLTYQERQLVAKIKGVSDNFIDQSPLEPFLLEGKLRLKKGHQNWALLGAGIQSMLSIYWSASLLPELQVYYPKNPKRGHFISSPFYTKQSIQPGAVFAVEKHFDDHYIITSLDFAASLMGLQDQRTALEIQVAPGFSSKKIKRMLISCLPEGLQVLDSDEQHATLMRAIRMERLFVLMTFSFILLIAAFNLFFIISMLILDKRKDLAILRSLGAHQGTIQAIFLLEGLFIGLGGAIVGMLVAYLLTWLQERFGLLSLGIKTNLIEAYPVKRLWRDFIYTTLGITLITVLATFRPAQLAAKTFTKADL